MVYCSGYQTAVETFRMRLEQDTILQQFINGTNKKVELVHKIVPSLESFLILPVQRIPRYSLLLGAILKFTPEDHPDVGNLTEAVAKLRSVADHLNQGVSNEEFIAKIFQIQKRFEIFNSNSSDQSIIAPHRKFMHEGRCQLENAANGPKEIYFYLFNDIFIIL